MVDPPLAARDEAIVLLRATAEVEHALMVQYLYAAYTVGEVPVGDPRAEKIKLIKYLLLHVAREEMAHLVTIQNLIHLLGGPLQLGREDSAFSSQLLPFRFKLEPLSRGSLAKYLIAESPRPLPNDGSLTEADLEALTGEITAAAKASNDGVCPAHVGDIFARLLWLFRTQGDSGDVLRLQDDDFVGGTEAFQASWEDVGHSPKARTIAGVSVSADPSIVRDFLGANVQQLRNDAVAAIRSIAAQGEGVDPTQGGVESHFDWFRIMYEKFSELEQSGGIPVRAAPINPNTTLEPLNRSPPHKMIDAGLEAGLDAGRISNARSRRWAQLFNLRYRILLTHLHHFLRNDTPRYLRNGDRTARGLLLRGFFREMRRLKLLAEKLTALPRLANTADPRRAGPPFELPETTELPDGEPNRWRTHLDTSRAASALAATMLEDIVDAADPFLRDLLAADESDQVWMTELSAGRPLPQQPQEFAKVVAILEDAVHGFTIGAHSSFWAGVPRGNDPPAAPLTGFVNAEVSGAPIITRVGSSFDASNSPLVRRLKGDGVPRMPRERPALHPSRVQYIEAWIAAGCPDSSPPYPGLLHEREPLQEPDVGGGMPSVIDLSFAIHIRPLFRPNDVTCMAAVAGFDLAVHADVKANAPAILARLEDGSMPPDGRWPQADLELFRAWLAAGCAP